jgi:hypothetical protein
MKSLIAWGVVRYLMWHCRTALGSKDGAREKEVCEKKGGEYLCLGIIIQEASKRVPQIFPK